MLAKGLCGGKASWAEGTVNAKDLAGAAHGPKQEDGQRGCSKVLKGDEHNRVGKADYVGPVETLERLGLYLLREVGAIAEG